MSAKAAALALFVASVSLILFDYHLIGLLMLALDIFYVSRFVRTEED